jgi:isoquinoline 1-oxidoreductase subunit beta
LKKAWPARRQLRTSRTIIATISRALYGNITIKDGRVEQSNFDTYQILRIDEAPAIDVHIVQSREPPGGMGEAGTSAIVPAVTNAIRQPASACETVDTTALKRPA